MASHRCAKVPMVSVANKRGRVAWSRMHKNDDFIKIIWSDEKRFSLLSDQPANCIRRKGERFLPQCTSKTVKQVPGIMVWGCFSANGTGILYRIPTGVKVNAKEYKNFDDSLDPVDQEATSR